MLQCSVVKVVLQPFESEKSGALNKSQHCTLHEPDLPVMLQLGEMQKVLMQFLAYF